MYLVAHSSRDTIRPAKQSRSSIEAKAALSFAPLRSLLLIQQQPLILARIGLRLLRVTIQDVVLDDEDGVVDHADVTKCKLDGVSCDATPVTLLVAVDGLLAYTKNTTSDIQQDLRDAPTVSALVVVVGDDLWRVLDQGDNKLDIAHGVNNIEGNPVIDSIVPRGSSNNATCQNNTRDTAGSYPKNESAGAVSSIWGKSPQRR